MKVPVVLELTSFEVEPLYIHRRGQGKGTGFRLIYEKKFTHTHREKGWNSGHQNVSCVIRKWLIFPAFTYLSVHIFLQ